MYPTHDTLPRRRDPDLGYLANEMGYLEDLRMPNLKLTKRAVESLKAPDPSGKQALHWDAELRGFGVLCSGVSSTKTYVVQTKLKTGQSRRLTIGPANVLSLDQAREAAKAKLAEIVLGGDPKVTARRRRQTEITLRQVFEGYLAASPNLSQSSLATYRKVMTRHLADWLDRPLRSVTAEMVEQRYRGIVKETSARREAGHIIGGVNVSGKASANLTMTLLRALWNHQADRDDTLGRNPVRLKKDQWHRLERRERHVRAEQLPAFYRAALALPSGIQRDVVLFALFTGMRAGEVTGLRWEEVDLPQRMIRIPARRMKVKRKFDLPMSSVVHKLLVARRALGNDGPFVFPGKGRSGQCGSFTYALRQIEAACSIKISPHDLRRTFATVAESAEISSLALKLLIAHATGGDITAGYQIMSPQRLSEAAEKVCRRMMELCEVEVPSGENIAALA